MNMQMETDAGQIDFEKVQSNIAWCILAMGGRASLQESHVQHVADTAKHLRELGHTVTRIEHSTHNPIGHVKSVVYHRSGPNRFTTIVRSRFNTEGKNHDFSLLTSPVEER